MYTRIRLGIMEVINEELIYLEPSYFQKLIDIPDELNEEDLDEPSLPQESNEFEEELPSDSYFIMILPQQPLPLPVENDTQSILQTDSSREISCSETSTNKRKNSCEPEDPKNLFYLKGEKKPKIYPKPKPSSAQTISKTSEIHFPLLMSGSVANDWIEEAKSEEEEETEKVQTEKWSNKDRVESTDDDYELEYSMQDTNPNLTNSKSYEAV